VTAYTTASCACVYLNRVIIEYIDNCAICLLTINEENSELLQVLGNMCLHQHLSFDYQRYYCSTDTCACAAVNSPRSTVWNSCVSCVEVENPLNATVLLNIEQLVSASFPNTLSTPTSLQPTMGIPTTTDSTSKEPPASTTGVGQSGVGRTSLDGWKLHPLVCVSLCSSFKTFFK